jgi:glyoxylase-like metal-dependent hydrolase (beta-lactamase superfamily II)
MKIPLEDLFEDIVGKAQRGLGVDDRRLSEKLKITVEQLRELKRGSGDSSLVPALAAALNLDAVALEQSYAQSWFPQSVPSVNGVAQFNTELLGMTVNAYVIWDPETNEGAIFDTGADASNMLGFVEARGLRIRDLFVTHTHEDHVACLRDIVDATKARIFSPELEPLPNATAVRAGQEFRVGNLALEARLTNGHSRGGTSYVVRGLLVPVVVVGDSLFAGSMGGAQADYQKALKNNLEQILTLPPQTVICPGHGPMSTVENEQANNPFLAKK